MWDTGIMSTSTVGWLSASELASRYCVGEARLLEHARRGNLRCRRDAQGKLHYEATAASRLFRTRVQAALPRTAAATNFGVLGQLTLGGAAPGRKRRAPARGSLSTSATSAAGYKQTSAA